MKFNYVSVKQVVAKIYRDLRLEDPNYELDIIEWCGEALAFIGAGTQFVRYVATTPITSFRCRVPSGMAVMEQVMYSPNETTKPKTVHLNDVTFPRQLLENEEFDKKQVTYSINGEYILFTREKGIAYISYKGVPVDSEGYPVVPDNQYYREALFWYCFKHILMLGYKSPAGIDYPFAESKWLFYCTAARNKANYPSIAEYNEFKQSWVGLLSNINRYDENFDNSLRETTVVKAEGIMTTPVIIPEPVIIDGGSPLIDGD